MISYTSIQELIEKSTLEGKRLSAIILEDQAEVLGQSQTELYRKMQERLGVMRESLGKGLSQINKSFSGMVGGDSQLLQEAMAKSKLLGGQVLDGAILKAIAIAEVNAAMGRIVAAPTAGSCGILPGVLLTVAEKLNSSEEDLVNALFTASGVGIVIAKNAGISGAAGGCQAECGSASGMAAAAVVEMAGGTPEQCGHACAIALKNILGLVCDPVAGLVEVPCVKRNAAGAANALVAIDLALAGIKSVIPVDEVILAMYQIGQSMPVTLKETALGGLAVTPTGCRLAKELEDRRNDTA
ncbi:L-serine ammonia-lyase, iron-sulfur-dependent, subunit alpha [Desulfosporosinus sp. BICA1-9]|uniref:L-serine ammonia-lyase, iron-sulfur-dependent, subunit alpha n=1 Tax=Desulfosporosinus sp. BICA1-9 TaxID=1531958 RepID=UPI00054B6097|nr:L-serine ammonia-lyase, iron-sulfur-dependent, subunit alpha [Desulfosporosinus sp. BICA1-9]KJS48578.1 MAG: serine dehydratase [Peptococcaceae bacterium BRH_c23]KJS89753.1 MAG: serine dehydratase [Desulfosporosinus sp. BICA1-9]HBW38128.1 L-serine ammonia-lyase, iron-sulfur-dependent, subunit alpha [Desulfosporosinus sp.]